MSNNDRKYGSYDIQIPKNRYFMNFTLIARADWLIYTWFSRIFNRWTSKDWAWSLSNKPMVVKVDFVGALPDSQTQKHSNIAARYLNVFFKNIQIVQLTTYFNISILKSNNEINNGLNVSMLFHKTSTSDNN